MFDPDYGPYRGDPRDPRYDDSEEYARDEWEGENTYADTIGVDEMEDILIELRTGSPERAQKFLESALDRAWNRVSGI